jgi:hypothetical protein
MCFRILVTLVVLFQASPVSAWNEPNGLEGVRWGISEEALRTKQQVHHNQCFAPCRQAVPCAS